MYESNKCSKYCVDGWFLGEVLVDNFVEYFG